MLDDGRGVCGVGERGAEDGGVVRDKARVEGGEDGGDEWVGEGEVEKEVGVRGEGDVGRDVVERGTRKEMKSARRRCRL